MADGTARLPRQGDVIQATVTDPNGVNIKRRPLVIVSRTIDIVHEQPFYAVAITSTFAEPLDPLMVALPWSNVRCLTGLTRPCVAHCGWVKELFVENVERTIGHVPTSVLKDILQRLATTNGE